VKDPSTETFNIYKFDGIVTAGITSFAEPYSHKVDELIVLLLTDK